MTKDTVIRVKNLTKTYRLYESHVDRVKETFHPFRKRYHYPFSALSNVSFDVKRGESVGIIGRNGSGKSTLLQIICGILQPTSGSIEVNGRISALLELGTGFNPEFTGRQNVYINGAILGLKNEEIEARFDDIVEFSELSNFIDQPIKTYSSGMYLRLAFAVAINVEPDILIVDEALAVGDEAFQRKCFSCIQEIQSKGKTILFVSHSASTVVQLCNRTILLDQGELLLNGVPKFVISKYHKFIYAPLEKINSMRKELKVTSTCGTVSKKETDTHIIKKPNKLCQVKENDYYDPELKPKSTISYESFGCKIMDPYITNIYGKRVNVLVRMCEYIYTYTVSFVTQAFSVGFGMMIKTLTGLELGGATTTYENELDYVEAGTAFRVNFKFKCRLLPGVYFLNAGVSGIDNGERKHLHRLLDAEMFRVQEGNQQIATGIVDFSTRTMLQKL